MLIQRRCPPRPPPKPPRLPPPWERKLLCERELICGRDARICGRLLTRGVSIQPGWTLRDLYNERVPMYERWADITVDCEALRLHEVVQYISQRVAE